MNDQDDILLPTSPDALWWEQQTPKPHRPAAGLVEFDVEDGELFGRIETIIDGVCSVHTANSNADNPYYFDESQVVEGDFPTSRKFVCFDPTTTSRDWGDSVTNVRIVEPRTETGTGS